jgi:hypothetical protein
MEETGRLFHASANGDTWLLVDNGLTNTITIKHQPKPAEPEPIGLV